MIEPISEKNMSNISQKNHYFEITIDENKFEPE